MTSTTLPRSKLSEDLLGWQGGDGPPLLLIHGVGLNADAWLPIRPYLEPHFSITAIDLPGHGKSPQARAETLGDYATCIAEVVPDNCIVVGHSLGALLTMALATIASKKITAIAPFNAVYQRSTEAYQAVKARAHSLDINKTVDHTATLERWFGDNPDGEDRVLANLCQDMLQSTDPIAYKQAYTIFAESNGLGKETLASIKCPALFITGSDEPNSTPEMSINLAKSVANGAAQIVANARHMMPMTHANEVAQLLIEFYQTKVTSNAKF